MYHQWNPHECLLIKKSRSVVAKDQSNQTQLGHCWSLLWQLTLLFIFFLSLGEVMLCSYTPPVFHFRRWNHKIQILRQPMKAAQPWSSLTENQTSRDRRIVVGLACSFHVTIKDVSDWFTAFSVAVFPQQTTVEVWSTTSWVICRENAKTSLSFSGNLLLPIQNTCRRARVK